VHSSRRQNYQEGAAARPMISDEPWKVVEPLMEEVERYAKPD
jgi:hypothetical protein